MRIWFNHWFSTAFRLMELLKEGCISNNMNIDIIFNIALALIMLSGLAIAIIKFIKLSKERKIDMINEWLLLAVVQAEKELGSGTGQIKLRYVYDLFIAKFKYFAFMVSFEQFSIMVDMALDKMRIMINNNDKLQDYIEGGR
jgi:hypothetical protein